MPAWAPLATALWEAANLSASLSAHPPAPSPAQPRSGPPGALSSAPTPLPMWHPTIPPSRVPGSCWPFPTGPNMGPGQGGPWTAPPCVGTVPQEGAGSLRPSGLPRRHRNLGAGEPQGAFGGGAGSLGLPHATTLCPQGQRAPSHPLPPSTWCHLRASRGSGQAGSQ